MLRGACGGTHGSEPDASAVLRAVEDLVIAGDESHVTWTDTGLRQTTTITDSQRCEGASRTVRLAPGLVAQNPIDQRQPKLLD